MQNKTKEWLTAAGIRAVRTFAQSVLSMVTVGQAIMDVNWLNVLSVSSIATLLSLLTSIITGLPELKESEK